MKKLFNKAFLLALLSLLTLTSWWAHNVSLFSSQNTINSKKAPKFFLSEVTAKRFSAEGYEKSILKFDSVISSSEEKTDLVRPYLIFHESSSSNFTVTADAGITEDNETISLLGNVTLQVTNAPNYADTSVGTNFAIVDIPLEILKTTHKTTITRNSLVGFSDGFIYDAKNGFLNLLSEVTLTYDD
ncbi:MAG: LPS export ABC transporter periplasmic protein LptC [Proteobacteria bacterium]|nr:LPS export ABC transporter periplasmic protein LptC [Pseudomonadota bacterium]MDA0862875.1 LPS export ABC transporter periplasmic protein LptC [Pseudomonadota bacterium]MDA1031568.1 LPS export ABC transporter periplasmic protein LptC [Pseudomonadota bacterium]